MMRFACLPYLFYNRHAVDVARDLLGKRLVRRLEGNLLAGTIIEAEAYQGEEDLACHARAGRTPRTAVMYGPPGRAYVYFTYGMHWLLNCVTGPEGSPAAVLIRALLPTEGAEQMAVRRKSVERKQWCSGPAKLCQAMAIDGHLNGIDLCDPQGELWIEDGPEISEFNVETGPRVGIDKVPEPWRSIPWRFLVRDGAAQLQKAKLSGINKAYESDKELLDDA
jgi:DNA-3-methyladenine glycosylase